MERRKRKKTGKAPVRQLLDDEEFFDDLPTTTRSTNSFSSSNSNNNNFNRLTNKNNISSPLNNSNSDSNSNTSSSLNNSNTASSLNNSNTASSLNNSNTASSLSNNNNNDSNTTSLLNNNTNTTSLIPVNITGRKSCSKVWLWAIKSADGQSAACKLCDFTCTTADHSTSTIRYHLIKEHDKYDLIVKSSEESDKPTISEHLKRELHSLCYRAIIIDQRSFNDFQKSGILDIFKKISPGYTPPHRNQVSKELKNLHNHYTNLLKNELKQVDYIGLTFDFWTNRQSMSFLCITGHWFKDPPLEFVSTVIDYSCFNERHTATNIAQVLKEKLMNLDIYHKIIAITCDGAPNVVAALNQLDDFIKRIWCCAHRLHIVVINALGFWKQLDDKDNTTSSLTNPATTSITSADVTSKSQENVMDVSWCSEDQPDNSSNVDTNNNNLITTNDMNLSHQSDKEGIDLIDGEEDIDETENIDLIEDCWSTTIDTTVATTEEIQIIIKLLKKCRNIARISKKSTIISAFIRGYNLLVKVNKTISIDCKSRWNSTFKLLESLILSKDAIVKLFNEKRTLKLTKDQLDKLCSMELNSHDWDFLSSLYYVLKPFFGATHLMSGKYYPSIGLSYHAIQKVYGFCLHYQNNNEQIIRLKKLLLSQLYKYFFNDPQQLEYLQYHAFFDPAAHRTFSDLETQQCERYVRNLVLNDTYPIKQVSADTEKSLSTAGGNSSYSTTSSESQHPFLSSNTSKVKSVYDAFIEACEDQEISYQSTKEKSKRILINEELKYFRNAVQDFNSKNEPSTTTAIDFWRKYHLQLPYLFNLAKVHLAACGTSVPSESAFSVSSYTARKERSRLSPENLCYSVFLKDKLGKS
ncbi:unnamed protein product [Adineta steineri]|uniref:HAT C-terminal dimerisation domain-containing protein n=1 Tax=Adineta steineri TaxID=433720 RepID=A0A819MRN5_9BILA|nr:unnamed protein product [Adineta steineri]CAF3984005.1 unnamed protein product [Adineta steineri]